MGHEEPQSREGYYQGALPEAQGGSPQPVVSTAAHRPTRSSNSRKTNSQNPSLDTGAGERLRSFGSQDLEITQQDISPQIAEQENTEKGKARCNASGRMSRLSVPRPTPLPPSPSPLGDNAHVTQVSDFREDWRLDDVLAEGSSATVHRTTSKGMSAFFNRNIMAVVKVSKPDKEDELVKEAKFLQHLGRHHAVVELLGFYHSKDFGTALVLEFLDGGKVLELVEQPCTEIDIQVVAVQVAQALGFIHSRGIVHRDVKAENIVFSRRDGPVKLVDFGLSAFEDDEKAMVARCGSPGYIAPEIINGDRYSFNVDSFSLGVVVYLLITGRLPFRAKTLLDVLRRTLDGQVKYHRDAWGGLHACRSFVASLLSTDPKERPQCGELWRHPWFATLIDQDECRPSSRVTSSGKKKDHDKFSSTPGDIRLDL